MMLAKPRNGRKKERKKGEYNITRAATMTKRLGVNVHDMMMLVPELFVFVVVVVCQKRKEYVFRT